MLLSQCRLNTLVAVRKHPLKELSMDEVRFDEVVVGHITGLMRDETGILVKVKLMESRFGWGEDVFYIDQLDRVVDLENKERGIG